MTSGFTNFSSLIDVSSFFIGVLVNLLLIALICYYFKKKTDNIEMAQSEQAKILYSIVQEKQEKELLQQESGKSKFLDLLSPTDFSQMNVVTNNVVDYVAENEVENDEETEQDEDEEDDESTVDTEVREEVEEEEEESVVHPVVEEDSPEVEDEEENTKTIELSEDSNQQIDYDSMTTKELREMLTEKNVPHKKNMKKHELVELLMMNHSGEELNIVLQDDSHGMNELEDNIEIDAIEELDINGIEE